MEPNLRLFYKSTTSSPKTNFDPRVGAILEEPDFKDKSAEECDRLIIAAHSRIVRYTK
jgi:hypothetical protein